MSISAALASFDWQDDKVDLIDTPGEPWFVADALGALRVCESGRVRGQRGHGRGGLHPCACGTRGELGLAGLIFVDMLDRGGASSPHPRVAAGRARPARGADGVRIGSARGSGPDRPGRREDVQVRRQRAERRQGGPIPDEPDRAGAEYREKLIDEVAGLRRADRPLPGGRGDLPRGDRRTALKDRTAQRPPVPRHLRYRLPAPRGRPAARGDRRGPALGGRRGGLG